MTPPPYPSPGGVVGLILAPQLAGGDSATVGWPTAFLLSGCLGGLWAGAGALSLTHARGQQQQQGALNLAHAQGQQQQQQGALLVGLLQGGKKGPEGSRGEEEGEEEAPGKWLQVGASVSGCGMWPVACWGRCRGTCVVWWGCCLPVLGQRKSREQ